MGGRWCWIACPSATSGPTSGPSTPPPTSPPPPPPVGLARPAGPRSRALRVRTPARPSALFPPPAFPPPPPLSLGTNEWGGLAPPRLAPPGRWLPPTAGRTSTAAPPHLSLCPPPPPRWAPPRRWLPPGLASADGLPCAVVRRDAWGDRVWTRCASMAASVLGGVRPRRADCGVLARFLVAGLPWSGRGRGSWTIADCRGRCGVLVRFLVG